MPEVRYPPSAKIPWSYPRFRPSSTRAAPPRASRCAPNFRPVPHSKRRCRRRLLPPHSPTSRCLTPAAARFAPATRFFRLGFLPHSSSPRFSAPPLLFRSLAPRFAHRCPPIRILHPLPFAVCTRRFPVAPSIDPAARYSPAPKMDLSSRCHPNKPHLHSVRGFPRSRPAAFDPSSAKAHPPADSSSSLPKKIAPPQLAKEPRRLGARHAHAPFP